VIRIFLDCRICLEESARSRISMRFIRSGICRDCAIRRTLFAHPSGGGKRDGTALARHLGSAQVPDPGSPLDGKPGASALGRRSRHGAGADTSAEMSCKTRIDAEPVRRRGGSKARSWPAAHLSHGCAACDRSQGASMRRPSHLEGRHPANRLRNL